MTAGSEPLVTLEELMFIHTVLRDRYGGGIGVRDRALIESALSGFGGRQLFPRRSLARRPYGFGLIQNHGFIDANKRTATMAMQLRLLREGFELEAEDGGLVAAAKAIANKLLSIESAANWVEERSQPAQGES